MTLSVFVLIFYSRYSYAFSAEANSEGGKCARNCVYLSCSKLGVKTSSNEIDDYFHKKDFVSVLEIRNFFREKDVYCTVLDFNGRNLLLLDDILQNDGNSLACIFLPYDSGSDKKSLHFILLEKIENNQLLCFDPSGRGNITFDLDMQKNLDNTKAVALLVTRKIDVHNKCEKIGYSIIGYLGLFISSISTTICMVCVVFILGTRKFVSLNSLYIAMLHVVRVIIRQKVILGVSFFLVIGIVFGYFFTIKKSFDQIMVSPNEINLKNVPVGSLQSIVFEIANRGTNVIEVEGIRGSCSCMSVQYPVSKIYPKSKILVSIELKIQGEGILHNSIFINFKDRSQGVLIPITCNGIKSSQLIPSEINIGSFPENFSHEKVFRFVMQDTNERSFSIENITPLVDDVISHNLVASHEKLENLKMGEQFTIAFKSNGMSSVGPFSQTFVLKTNEATPQKYFLRVNGEITPQVSIYPDSAVAYHNNVDEKYYLAKLIFRSLLYPVDEYKFVLTTSEGDVRLENISDDKRSATVFVKISRITANNSKTHELKISHNNHELLIVPVKVFPRGD